MPRIEVTTDGRRYGGDEAIEGALPEPATDGLK
jgi:hypothetical protein